MSSRTPHSPNALGGSYLLGLFSLVALAMSYASFGVLSRLVSSDLGVFQQLTVRIGVGALLATVVLYRSVTRSRLRAVSSRDWRLLVFRCVLAYLVGGGAFVAAVGMTTIANVAFLCAFPFEVLLAPFILGEVLSRGAVAGFMLAVVGALLVSVGGMHLHFGGGEFLALLSAFGMALYYLLRRLHAPHLDHSILTVCTLWIGAFLLLLATAFVEGLPSSVPVRALWLSLGLGVLNAANVFFANYGFAHVPASVAGITLMLEIPLSVLLGYLLFYEVPGPMGIIGGSMIVVGAVVAQYRLR